MGKVIAVVSGKGGTGKTTTVGAVASCLAVLGKKVLCVDMDAGLKNLDITLGMPDFAVADFYDVISGAVSLSDACSEHPLIPGLYFLSAPMSLSPADLIPADMRKLADEAKADYDFCFIDAPAGIGSGFSLAVGCADAAIIVATGDISSMRGGQRVAEELRERGVEDIRLVVNRVKTRGFRLSHSTIDNMIDSVGVQLLGVVKDDPDVTLAANLEKPLVLFTDRGAAREFLRIARRIAGEHVPLPYK